MQKGGSYWDRVLSYDRRKILLWILFELIATALIGNWIGGVLNSRSDRAVCLFGVCWPQPPSTAAKNNFVLGAATYLSLGWVLWGIPQAYADAGISYSLDLPSPLLFFSLHLFLLIAAFVIIDHFTRKPSGGTKKSA